MAILYHAGTGTISLHTRNTTYQMKIGNKGHLLHLYYGRRVDHESMEYCFVLTDRGFSPNSYEARYRRDISLDVLPQEYSSSNSGDFRIPALECIDEDGIAGTDLRYVSHEIQKGKYCLPGLPAAFAEEGEAETLSVLLKDEATGLKAELLFGVFEEADMLTRAVIIRNRGTKTVTLEKAASLCLDIPFGRWELLHFHGRHCMERIPERTPLMHGVQTVSSRRGASSHHHNPFAVLLEPSASETRGECVGVMPVYSGNHRTDIEVDQTGAVRVISGINQEMFSWRLGPGEQFAAPEIILCRTGEGLGDLSRHYHDFIRRHIMRSAWKDRPSPVVINNWEAMTFHFTSETLLEFARESARLGAELMVLDDGWFGRRNSDNEGLGDWFANEEKLPGGLKPLSDAIHAMGMKFGLWIEPEMVNEESGLYRAHRDWALAVPGRKPVMGRNQMVLDMGRKEVVDHLCRTFSALIRENGIDYIKWDMNRNMADVYSHALPPERQKETSHRYILGVYDLLERLTAEFPEVLFEGCAGGGGRFDAGMLYYTPQIWCSDDTDAIERIDIQLGTSVGYPVRAVSAHVSVCPNQQTGRTVSFGTRGIVAMSGAFGYELDPQCLTEPEKEEMKKQIARYHRWQDLIRRGAFYRLNENREQEDFAAWQFVSEDGAQTLLNFVMTHTRANARGEHIRLRGLHPDAKYRLAEIHYEGRRAVLESAALDETAAEERTYSGAGLMYAGYTLPPLQGDFPGAQLLFTRVDPSEGGT